MAELRVDLSGDPRDLLKALDQVEKALKDTEKVSATAVDKISKPLNNAGNSVKSFSKNTANATPVVTEFSRVIQDAPFGIRGVANNLQQLTGNFTNLQKSTGSTTAALKASVAALTGPAGVLLAVSAVTSLLVQLSNSNLTLSDTLSKVTGGLTEETKALKALNEAQNEAVGTAQSEIEVLNVLVGIAQDNTKSSQERQRALAKINDEYGDYLPNLTQEKYRHKRGNKSY